MDTHLLSTKLFIPPVRPGLVSRSRLIERLSESRDCPLIVVSAPAGFGKTTMLTQWIAENRPPQSAAWVSLDEGDSDPVRFWDYLIAALRKLRPDVGETASTMLHSPQPYPLESSLTTLINDLTATPGDLALVLDDYHLIKADVIHEGVAFLVEHAPPGMHVVISTRTDPDLPLARLRGRGSVIEMRADDLRFRPDEATDLLQELLGTAVPPEQLDALNAKTEGWVAGLKMAALSLQGRPDIGPLVASLAASNRYVMDYLLEEVLQLQSAEVRDYLLKTSVLQKLCGPLCDALVDAEGSERTLRRLESANLFLVPLDEAGQWYRYHHLFGELLRHQLETHYGAETVTRLHQRASQWYEDNKLPDDAIHHALAARDWEGAMRLLNGVTESRLKRGENATLLNWFQAVPNDVLRTDPHLYRQYARALVQTGQLDAAQTVLLFLETESRGDANMQGEVAALQTDLVIRKGDIPRAIELGEKALSLLSPDNFAYRCRASHILGVIAHDRGLYDEAWSRMTDAYEAGRQAADLVVGLEAYSYLGDILLLQGSLRRAAEVSQRATELAGQSPAAGPGRYFLGNVLYEWNRIEESTYNLQLAADLLGARGTPDNIANSNIVLANARLASGDLAGCVKAMETARQAEKRGTMRPATWARQSAWRILLAIRQDDLKTASHWFNRLSEHSEALSFQLRHFPVRLLIARGEKAEAAEQLRGLYEKALQAGAQSLMIGIRVYQTLATASAAEALPFLTEALRMGEPEGFIRTFVDEGKLLAPLLRRVKAEGAAPGYAARLLSIIENEEHERKVRGADEPAIARSPGRLSEREMEVLGLVAKGLSDRQIAARLMISLSTAKTHVHRILEKLDATSRTQAITQARELKLI